MSESLLELFSASGCLLADGINMYSPYSFSELLAWNLNAY